MINKILKKHKLTMEQFHDKYPTEADFAKAHPKDYAELQKFASGGKLPEGILRARLESHMSSDEAQDYINEYGKGGYTVTRSNDRKGKTHKVTGPDGTVKYFGDSKLGQHPSDPKRKKAFYARHAKNLKNNPYFRAFARATWAEGGYLDGYTEQDFAKGGRFWKDFGAGAYGAGEGLLDTLSMGLTDNLTDKGYAALQNLGNSTEDEKREQDAVRGFSNAAGAITGGILNPAATGSAIAEGTEGLGAGISKTWQDNEAAQMAGQILPTAGNIASMFTGNIGAGSSQAAKFAGSDFGKMASMAGKAGKYYNMFSPMMQPMLMNAKGGFYNTIAGSLEGNMRYAQGGELVDLVGPKHTEGGIMLTNNAEVEGGETKLGNYIYSDQLEYQPGVTFAKQSKKIKNRYKLRKGGDLIDNEQMNRELMDLQDANEEARVASEAEEAFEMAKGGWIKKATESIKKRGTEGVCTGSKFGGPTCPPGSKRYNLAKTFRKMAKSRKHAEGGFIGELYALGGDIDMFSNGGPFLSDEGYAAINQFENTIGTFDPVTGQPKSMEMGDQYAQTHPDNKKIQDYISKNIGMDTWDKLPDNLKTQAYSFMFNTGMYDAGLKGIAQAINNSTGGGDLGNQRRAYTPEQAIQTIKSADLSNPNLYDNYLNVLGDQYNSIADTTKKYQSGPGAVYAPTLRNRALSINKNLTSNNAFYPTPTGEAIPQNNPFYPTPSGNLSTPFYPTPDGGLPKDNTKKPFYPTPDGNLPKSPGTGNKFDMNQAASLFGKYGSLLGLPLQGMAVGQANRAIKDELKRLKGEKPEIVDYGTVSLQGYTPTLQDPTQALLEQDQLARAARYNTEQVGAGNLGTMMANKQVADAMAMKQKARTRAEYDNANAALRTAAAQYGAEAANKGTLYNKELQKAGMDATSQSKANYQNQLFKLAQAMGQNRASGLQAGAQGIGATAQNVNYNQQMLNTLSQLFSNPETLKMLAQFGAGK